MLLKDRISKIKLVKQTGLIYINNLNELPPWIVYQITNTLDTYVKEPRVYKAFEIMVNLSIQIINDNGYGITELIIRELKYYILESYFYKRGNI